MTRHEDLRPLRAAVYTADGAAVVKILRTGVAEDDLQLAGDGLLVALAQRAAGTSDLAREAIFALRERDWEGDEELANQLDELATTGAITDRKPLPVDLEQLSDLLEGDATYGSGRVELATGEVVLDDSYDLEDEEDEPEDPDKWLWVQCEGSRDGYWDMERFIGTVRDPGRADRLGVAIGGGSGAFRRFRAVLARWPSEADRWYAFSAECKRGRARAWLAESGYYVQLAARQRSRP